METNLIKQLVELTEACQKRNIKPIICGGLGVYLSFCRKEDEIKQMLRATQDVDLMFSKQDLLEEVKRNAMADMIKSELKYRVREDKKHHGFRKEPDQELDILVPPVKELERSEYRLKIVKSTLHGHITEEAEFIDEDLRCVSLPDAFDEITSEEKMIVYVPCPTNLMIMKLYAFSDRIEGKRKDADRAMAHAFDVYITIMLATRDDLLEGQEFISRHKGAGIILKANTIISQNFSNDEKRGWQTVLSSPGFYSQMSLRGRQEKLRQACIRLRRWFDVR